MRVSACSGPKARSKYHVADILPATSESALLTLIIDADEQGFAAMGRRAIIVLEALDVVL